MIPLRRGCSKFYLAIWVDVYVICANIMHGGVTGVAKILTIPRIMLNRIAVCYEVSFRSLIMVVRRNTGVT